MEHSVTTPPKHIFINPLATNEIVCKEHGEDDETPRYFHHNNRYGENTFNLDKRLLLIEMAISLSYILIKRYHGK